MKRKTILSPALFSLLLLLGCGMSGLFAACDVVMIRGNGKLITREIPISNVKEIKIGGQGSMSNMEIVYEQRNDTVPYFQITVDENIFNVLDIQAGNKSVVLTGTDNQSQLRPTECRIKIYTSNLETFKVGGEGDIYVPTKLTSPELEIDLAGACKMTLQDSVVIASFECDMAGSCDLEAMKLNCTDFTGKMAGSNDFLLGGKVASGKIQSAGKGKVKALDCIFDNLAVKSAGSCYVEATVNEDLNIKAAGSMEMKYKGIPTIRKKVAGSFELTQIKD